jgi:fructose-1,6-bisphosphatase/inositol monophosphatase family enzyme
MLAAGAVGAMFCKRCKIWDVAAGVLLVREAGGRVTDPSGEPVLPFDLTADPDIDTPIFAAAPNAHKRLLAGIRSVAP